MTFFAKPVVLVINNLFSGLLGKFDIYTLHHVEIKGFDLITYALPLIFALFVGLFSLTKGRLYCNMVCPVGTFLGLISKVSLFRIRIDEGSCKRCGRCAIACKSSCIDFLGQDIDVSRCVDCFNCITSCPENAISYSLVGTSRSEKGADQSKRKFIAGSVLFLAGITQSANSQEKNVPVPKKASTVREPRTYHVCPPGAGSLSDFMKNCTACSLCISACPNQVIIPAVRQFGIAGFMMPVMDYHKSFCTYNCTICTEVCPTNALKPSCLKPRS